MIRIQDLQEAIAECQGQRNPNANTCIKLASYLTILNYLKEPKEEVSMPMYSYASQPEEAMTITYKRDTEFGRAVAGKDPNEVMAVIDELMSTLQGMIPRLYEGVMSRIY